ncbi:hypothetical protein [Mycolicibacterium sediminis]|uniref:hypothetical protein n=1 Tax=Mycolicibacterium sediminis TaxID=1286180 RepID=UPI0039088E2E
MPHFESKRRVEECIEILLMSVTFVRPSFFYDDLRAMFTWLASPPWRPTESTPIR